MYLFNRKQRWRWSNKKGWLLCFVKNLQDNFLSIYNQN